MTATHARRALAGALLATVTSMLVAPPAALAQQANACSDPSGPTPEKDGPTDISAVTGNQRLSVALNEKGTVTVLKWPSPSYYDQIKYRTTDRGERFDGALPNEGAFFGVAWRNGPTRRARPRWRFQWLRRWPAQQRFKSDDGDTVETIFRKPSAGLKVTLVDVVAPNNDVLARTVRVHRSDESSVRRVRVISFANFNPVFSKNPQDPTDDWCNEQDNDDGADYVAQGDAILATRSGQDASTGRSSSVALAMGFGGRSDAHTIGTDVYQSPGTGTSAYDDASDGGLSEQDSATGQSDAAIADDLSLRGKNASTTAFIAVAATEERALATLRSARSRGAAALSDAKARWWRAWLRGAPLPKGAPSKVVRLAKRALISIRQATDAESGLVVASVATQSPYGLDWIRNGAYVNHALDLAGHPEMVRQHDHAYARLQIKAANPNPAQPAPPGNWSQNYYADGVVGGPIPYEIDETGFGIWTLWDHYALTKDRNYLLSPDIYEAIQRAAQYLSDPPPSGCIDPTTGLQCMANEGDDPGPKQTLEGAEAVWMGLDAAAKAAAVRGTDQALQNAEKWTNRRDQLGAAIDARLYDEDCRCYTSDHEIGGTLLWPARYLDAAPAKARDQADANWRAIRPSLRRRAVVGGDESKTILGNAYTWAGDRARRRDLERALEWVAGVPTTPTGILGETWMHYPDEHDPVVTMLSQPDVASQAIFYLAALKVYGSSG